MKYTLDESREWYNNLPGKRASAAMIIRHDGKYLLIKDDYKRSMTFPSGVIDPNESPLTTAIRETGEEVGIQLLPTDVTFFSVSYIAEHHGFNDRFHFFFIADIGKEAVENMALEKGIEYHKWVNANEIDGLSGHSGYKKLSEMLQTGTVVSYFEV
jgi:8-oxo-dGTP pyrophosphatase MutT (NUDIX family)